MAVKLRTRPDRLLEALREAMPDELAVVGLGHVVGTTTADALCRGLAESMAAGRAALEAQPTPDTETST